VFIKEHVFHIDIPGIPRSESRKDILHPDGILLTNGPPFIKENLKIILQPEIYQKWDRDPAPD